MQKISDVYKTIDKPGAEVLFKNKNSKFFGYSFPVTSSEQVKEYLTDIKKRHYTARHWCYAWQIGTDTVQYRVNDDGEPSNTAGQPIYGQIQSFELTNILVIVVRYFGGVKLGVGGLITSYRAAAKLSIEKCNIIEKTIDQQYVIRFQYKDMNKIMRIIKEQQIKIINQVLEEDCKLYFSVRKSESDKIIKRFDSLYETEIKLLSS